MELLVFGLKAGIWPEGWHSARGLPSNFLPYFSPISAMKVGRYWCEVWRFFEVRFRGGGRPCWCCNIEVIAEALGGFSGAIA